MEDTRASRWQHHVLTVATIQLHWEEVLPTEDLTALKHLRRIQATRVPAQWRRPGLAVCRHGEELVFTIDPGLSTGDRIVLRSSIACGTSCSDNQLAIVTGVRNFGNGGTYSFGNVVTATIVPILTIMVSFNNTVAAEWARTSAAVTNMAITATSAKGNLKVCWGFVGSGTYVKSLSSSRSRSPNRGNRSQLHHLRSGHGRK